MHLGFSALLKLATPLFPSGIFLMNKNLLVSSLLALGLSATTALAKPPRYPVQPVEVAPVIDGKLDDTCWSYLPSAGPFVDKNSKMVSPQTTLRFGYDKKNLYIAARLEEPEMDKVKANVTERDGGVWKDDDLEIFLGTKGKVSPFMVFRINSLGTLEETSMDADAKGFNFPWEGKATREKDAWIVEIAIPFSSLNSEPPAPGAVWRGNVGRNRAHAKKISTWCQTPGQFADTDAFGELFFTDRVIFKDIKISTQDLEGGVNMRVEASGPAAKYRTRLYGMLDGKQEPAPKELYSAITLVPEELKGTNHNYVRPEAKRIVLQPELIEFDKPGTIFFRGEAILAKEEDPATSKMAQITSLLKDFPASQAPAAFRNLAPTWEARLAELKKQPEIQKLADLLQEVKCAKWMGQLPPNTLSNKNSANSVLTFPVTSFLDLDYKFLPEASAIGAPVKIQAMRDEYEPGCLNVFALNGNCTVLPTVSDLKGPGGATLPASAFDVRVLKGWYQAGKGGFQDPSGIGVWANELLLKDDSMISTDHAAGRNTIHRINDTVDLQPVKIEPFESRQFWLTLKVPKDQAPGLYEGTVRITSNGAEVATVPLQVQVLPLTMEKGKFTFTMYYYGLIGKGEKTDRGYEADLKLMSEYGLTSVFVQDGAEHKQSADGMVAEYDFSKIRKALELRKKYGLTGRTVLAGGSWHTKPVDMLYRRTFEELTASPIYQNNWTLFGKGFTGLANELGFEHAYVYGLDEPGYDPTGKKMKIQKLLCEWATQADFQICSAITLPAAETIKEILAVANLDAASAVIGSQRCKLPLPGEAWLYTHPDEHPTYDRLFAGLFVWYGGYTGAAPWLYQWAFKGEGWDDWVKNPYGYRLQSYAYPGETAPVPTRQLAGFREGADDVKYLEMLENRVKALTEKQGQLDEGTRTAWQTASKLVNEAPKQFHGTGASLHEKVDGQMLADFRAQVADLLVKLDTAVKAGK
jgi:hypothetical protein